MRFLILALLCAPSFANAEEFYTELWADLNGDGLLDRAELMQAPKSDMASLSIYSGLADGTQSLTVIAHDLVWVGSAQFGQTPELGMNEQGSLQVISMNEAIGRNRWHEYLTIAYRSGAYRMAGYTYNWNDTLDLSDQGVCDVNLLNGKAELTLGDGAPRLVSHTSRAVPINEWPEAIPQVCAEFIN